MKGLYEKYKRIDDTLVDFCFTGRIAKFPNAMGRKLLWLMVANVLGKDIDLVSLSDSIPIPRKKVKLGNVNEVMAFSNDVNLYSKDDVCGNFIAPSLQDIYLLEWADRLYEQIIKERKENVL